MNFKIAAAFNKINYQSNSTSAHIYLRYHLICVTCPLTSLEKNVNNFDDNRPKLVNNTRDPSRGNLIIREGQPDYTPAGKYNLTSFDVTIRFNYRRPL